MSVGKEIFQQFSHFFFGNINLKNSNIFMALERGFETVAPLKEEDLVHIY